MSSVEAARDLERRQPHPRPEDLFERDYSEPMPRCRSVLTPVGGSWSTSAILLSSRGETIAAAIRGQDVLSETEVRELALAVDEALPHDEDVQEELVLARARLDGARRLLGAALDALSEEPRPEPTRTTILDLRREPHSRMTEDAAIACGKVWLEANEEAEALVLYTDAGELGRQVRVWVDGRFKSEGLA